MIPRYVRKDRRPPHDPARQCAYCGRWTPSGRDEIGRPVCPVAVCKCCGTPQCFGNGGGNGQCAVCYVGLLPGWSGSETVCTYKKCGQPAVARGRGRRPVCSDHARHQKIGTPYLEQWELVP